jgi:filamentous hemagglutinin family protein
MADTTDNFERPEFAFLLVPILPLLLCLSVRTAAQDVSRIEKGDVEVRQNADETHIEASDGAIIRYSSFDVGSGETVQFHQPGKQARVLNRIRSGSPSQINGNLFANGQVFLTNPAGIVFGNGATVDVGRLYAAAGRISNENFQNGVNQFTDLSGTVKNLGDVRGTEVHLLGDRVRNFGTVVADAGVVTMTSGEDVLIGSIDESTFARITDDGESMGETGPAVQNSGSVRAEGGNVQVGAGDMYSLAIESTGDVYAQEVEVDGGDEGQVQLSGQISATTTAAGKSGGDIDVVGDELVLRNLDLDASGPAEGGNINVGGSRKGEGPLPNASNVLVDSETTLSADATQAGDGGDVIVWSDGSTFMKGHASARGGPDGGDGGFVEISGKQLDTSLNVADVSAPNGLDGNVLFDPDSIEIQGGSNDGDDSDALIDRFDSDGDGNSILEFGDSVGSTFTVFESEIEGTILSTDTSDITLSATDSISVSGTFSDSALVLQTDVSLTLRTRNDGDQGDSAGNIDLRGGGSVNNVVTQGNGSITIQGSTSGDLESNLILPALDSSEKISLYTGNGEIRLFGGMNQNTSGSIVRLGQTTLSGSEVEGGNVVLMNDVSIETGVGFSEFATPINSQSGERNFLDVQSNTDLEIQDNVGTSVPLSSITVFGEAVEMSLSGTTIRTDGEQQYGVPAIRLEGDSSLNISDTGSGNILMNARIFSEQTDGPYGLTIDAKNGVAPSSSPEVAIGNAVGRNLSGTEMPLASLDVDVDGAISFGRDPNLTSVTSEVRTSMDQDYDGNVGLASETDTDHYQFYSSNGNVRFRGLIDTQDDGSGTTNGTSSTGLIARTPAGDTRFEGAVGGGNLQDSDPDGLKFLTTDDGTVGGILTLAGDLTTVNDQIFNEPVELASDITLNAANFRFRNTVNGNGDANGPWSFTVNTPDFSGETDFEAEVGTANPIGSITTDQGGVVLLPKNGTVRTSGDQSYGNSVEVSDSTVESTDGLVEFQQFVDAENDGSSGSSAWGLTVKTPSGGTTFGSEVGGGNVSESDPDGLGFLNVDTASGTSGTLNLPITVTTTGDQVYGENRTLLIFDTTLVSNGGTIDLSSTDTDPNFASQTLTLDPAGGGTKLGNVGASTNRIGGITVSSATSELELSGTIYTDGVFDNSSGNIPNIQLTGETRIDNANDADSINFSGMGVNADATGAHGLTLDAGTGNISMDSIGSSTALADLDVDSTGTTTINGSTIQTDGGPINLVDAPDVELNAGTTVILDSESGDDTSAGNILLGSSSTPGQLDSAGGDSLSLQANTSTGSNGGNVALGAVGQTDPTGAITVRTAGNSSDGSMTLHGNVHAQGTVNFTVPTVNLGTTLTLETTTSGAIDLGSGDRAGVTDNGNGFGLTIDAVGPVDLNDVEVSSLNFTSTNGDGTAGTSLSLYGRIEVPNGADFTGIDDGDTVTLQKDVSMFTAGSDVTFAGERINAAGAGLQGLFVDTDGDFSGVDFGDATSGIVTVPEAGTSTSLATLRVEAGDVNLTGPITTSTDVELFEADASVNGLATGGAISAPGGIQFTTDGGMQIDHGLDSGSSSMVLTLDNDGGGDTAVVNAQVIAGDVLFKSPGPGVVEFTADPNNTSGDLFFSDGLDQVQVASGVDLTAAGDIDLRANPFVLNGGTTVLDTSSANGNIDLSESAVSENSATTLQFAAGTGLIQTADVTIDALAFNSGGAVETGGSITTTASDIDFRPIDDGDTITLQGDTVLDASGSVLTAGERINGSHDLDITAGSNVDLGPVGNKTPLAGLDVNATSGTTTLNGDVLTNGGNGILLDGSSAVTLASNARLDTSGGNGRVRLDGGAVDGVVDLTITAGSGNVDLGPIGQNTGLTSLDVTTVGSIDATSNITVSDSITFSGDLRTAAGTVVFNAADVQVDQRLEVGDAGMDNSVGTLDVNADLTLSGSSTFEVTLDSTTSYDQIEVDDGVAETGGDIVLADSPAPDLVGTTSTSFSDGDTFDVIQHNDADAVNGSFSNSSVEIDGEIFDIRINENVAPGDGNDVVLERVAGVVWIGDGGDSLWSTDANWLGESGPSDGDFLVFDTDDANTGTSNNDLLNSVGRIAFNSNGTDSYTLIGDPLSVQGDIVNNSSVTQAIQNDLTFPSGGHAIDAASGRLVFDGTIDGPGSVTFTNSNANGTTIQLNGEAGGSTPLSTITVDPELSQFQINTATVTSDAQQRYDAPVRLDTDVTLASSNGNIRLNAPVNSRIVETQSPESLTLDASDNITLQEVGTSIRLSDLVFSSSFGTLTLNGSIAVNSGLDFTPANDVVLGSTLTVNTSSTDGNVTFLGNPINGAEGLTLRTGAGSITLDEVGAGTSLSSLTLDTTGIVNLHDTTGLSSSDSIRTEGPVDLSAATGGVVLQDRITITSGGGSVDMTGSSINAAAAGEQVFEVNAGSGTARLPALGNSTPLSNTRISGGTVYLNGSIRAGNSSAGGLVEISSSNTTVLNSSVTIETNAGDSTAPGPVDFSATGVEPATSGSQSLALDVDNTAILLSDVGSATKRLGGLSFLSSFASLTLNGTVITDGGFDTVTNGGPVFFSGNTQITAENVLTGNIFAGSNGPYNLTIEADGSPGDLTVQTISNAGSGGTVELRAGGLGQASSIETDNLLLRGFTEKQSDYDLSGPNQINTLAVSTPTDRDVGDVHVRDVDGFTVGSVNPSGITTYGTVRLQAGPDSTLTINGGISSGGPVDIAADSLTFDGFASIKANGGSGVINIAPEVAGDAGDHIEITGSQTGAADVLELLPIDLETRLSASRVNISRPGAGSLSVNNGVDLSAGIDGLEISSENAYDLFLGSTNSVQIGAPINVGQHSIIVRSTGDLTLNNNGTELSASGSGNRIDLATSSSFVNNVGPNVMNAGSGARWLVYSSDPDANTPGGLVDVADFEEFDVLPPNDPVGSGNGFYYAVAEVTDENLTTDISSSTTGTDQETTAETTTEEEQRETDTTRTADETETQLQTDTLIEKYGDQEISESISEVEEPSGELTSMVDDPTQDAANNPSYDQKIRDDATKSYDDSQGEARQAEEQLDNLEAQSEQYEQQGDSEQAEEKQEQAEETEEELEQAQEQLNQAQQETDPDALLNEQLRQRLQQESTQVRESMEDLDMQAYRNENQVDVTNVEVEGNDVQPSNISAQELRDQIVDELQSQLQEQDTGHTAKVGTVKVMLGVDPIKGVGGSHIRSVSMSGTKAVPDNNEDVKTYYDKLTDDVKDWDKENTLRFQLMSGGGEDDWTFGLINIFLNRETGVYLIRSNLDILEGAASKLQGSNFESFVQEEQVESFEGRSTSFTVSGELQ